MSDKDRTGRGAVEGAHRALGLAASPPPSRGDRATSWCCAATLPSREGIAIANLRNQGFQAFTPLYPRTVRHARRASTRLVPLFPGYVFLDADPDRRPWRSVNGTRGVRNLVMNGERPAIVPPTIIAGLKAACDARGVVAPDRLETIRAGDSVRILLGPLANCVAQVERIDAGDRARILVEFLGATREVSLAQSALLRSA